MYKKSKQNFRKVLAMLSPIAVSVNSRLAMPSRALCRNQQKTYARWSKNIILQIIN